jgi:hypothetical protein
MASYRMEEYSSPPIVVRVIISVGVLFVLSSGHTRMPRSRPRTIPWPMHDLLKISQNTSRSFSLWVSTCTALIYSQLKRFAQVNPGNGQFSHAIREMPGPTQATNSYPSAHGHGAHHTHPLGPPTIDNLRQLANGYMDDPRSQVNAVCTERTSPGRYKVTIALEVTDIS